jgi:lipid-binding SYLF domain-containing protein
MKALGKIVLLSAMFVALASAVSFIKPNHAYGASAQEIDIKVDATLKVFASEVKGATEFLKSAKGVLVFPSVLKAGIGVGGEYGEGALRINGKTVDYYNTAAASIGFQLGVQEKSIVIVFMQDKALANFRDSSGWKAGVDGSVALVEWGKGEDINTIDIQDPIVGFVFGNKGLMFNLTLEGSKFTKIKAE